MTYQALNVENHNPLDITIEICGSSGDGSIAAGQILNHAVTALGYHVMNFDSYPAEIRGFGKSVAHSRISSASIFTPGSRTDCLIALDDPHSIPHLPLLKDRGVIIYDSKPMDYHEEDQAIAGFIEPGMVGYGVPLRELSTKAVNSSKSRNIVALGVMAGVFHIPPEGFHQAISTRFHGKKESIISTNIAAFDLGYEFGSRIEKADPVEFPQHSKKSVEGVAIISGNQAAAQACLDAGIRLYAGYPITPATRIMEILAKELPKKGGVVIQTEDEISAIGHIVGAGFAGTRAATATSGPGLCLMTEFINLAVIAEIPIVVIDSQRAGPSTGLPTKNEQSDLNIAIFGGSGDSPRVVLAPANVSECYSLVHKAFEIAEAFQTPVLVLLDFFLSNRLEDIDISALPPDRYGQFSHLPAVYGTKPYQRYALTDSGVSPRALPGQENCFYTSTGLEHNQTGFPDYSADNHQKMHQKRYKKMAVVEESWQGPDDLVAPEGPLEIGIISWGSTIGSALEALDILSVTTSCGGYFPRMVWPLRKEPLLAFAKRCKTIAVVEMNGSGQMAALVEQVTKREIVRIHNVYAGMFPVADILEALNDAPAPIHSQDQP